MDKDKLREARRMRHVYDALGIDGRTRKSKYFIARWKALSPKLGGDPVKEALLVRALKFESDNPSMTGHDLRLMLRMYVKLGLLAHDDADDENQSFEDYLLQRTKS